MADIQTGQRWTYRTAEGFEDSRLVVGAIASFDDGQRIVCCSVTDAPRRLACGTAERVTIPFLPLSEAAFRASVLHLDGDAQLPPEFGPALAEWSADTRGLTEFTVAFDGYLDRMIARQMAAIVGRDAA